VETNAVVVVSHPDDETLWAGGYLQAHPGTDVLVCTIPIKDPQRCADFFQVCKALKANGSFVARHTDREPLTDLSHVQRLVEKYDLILTHNEFGEYGHEQHIAVHRAMKATGVPMRVFGYGKTTVGNEVSLEFKRKTLELYTTRPNCFKVWSKKFDLSREAFLPC
jgi:LmbE family N-acetylglucosaminyl deacetylase